MASDMAQLPVTADNIQQAVRLMYGQANPNPEATQAASRWLTAAKASPQAWDFLWVLLMPDKVSHCDPLSPHVGTHSQDAVANEEFDFFRLCLDELSLDPGITLFT